MTRAKKTPPIEQNLDALRMVAGKIDTWNAMREELAALERAEHPDIIDTYGRAWQWVDGDLYDHDKTLALPRDMIQGAGLPHAKLDNNPNYSRLCYICTFEWPNPRGTQ